MAGRLPSDNPRYYAVTVQLSRDERRFVEEESKAGGCSLSAVLRQAVLKTGRRPVVPEVNQRCWSELAATTANLNQLTHSVNAGKLRNSDSLLPVLEKLGDEVRELRLALLGINEG